MNQADDPDLDRGAVLSTVLRGYVAEDGLHWLYINGLSNDHGAYRAACAADD